MARPRKPWYRKPRDTWFVEIDGKQVPLAKGEHNRTAADKEFHRLMSLRDEPDPSAAPDSVVSLLGRFLGWTKKHKSPATYDQRRYFLRSFVRHRGVKKLRPERVTVEVVEAWLDAHPKWKASRRHATLSLLRAFNWSVKRGKIARNPIAAIEVPVQQRVLTYLTGEQRKKLFEATKDKAFKNVLTALSETGCRPGEISAVTAADVNLELGVWVLKAPRQARRRASPASFT